MLTRAFGTTWKAVGIMLTAMSLYAFAARVWGTPLSELVAALVGAYQALFHPIVGALFGWLPFELGPLAKDLLIIWFAIGGSLARTFYDLFETGAGKTTAKWSRPLLSSGLDALIFNNILLRVLCLWLCVLLWPLALIFLLIKPKVCVSTGGKKYALIGDRDVIPTWGGQQHYAVRHDLRIVFALYLVAVAAVVGVVAVLNVMTS